MEKIPPEFRKSSSLSLDPDSRSKVLGLIWNPQNDTFSFEFNLHTNECTKRNVLSNLARIFDPIGFLGPVLLLIKGLIKELWALKIGWDESPPAEFTHRWETLMTQLPVLANCSIPRHVGVVETCKASLVGFCDGSNTGYGAVVYLRTCNGNKTNSSLYCARSRVTPLKASLTTPRIELCSAHTLACLLHSVLNSISSRIQIEKVFAFTDSTITLCRIKSQALKEDVFVRNRVTKIREKISPDCWFHVGSSDNPADCLSRGILPQQLLEHSLWWHGPPWLLKPESEWPKTYVAVDKTVSEEKIGQVFFEETKDHPLLSLASRCSSWSKLLNATVHILRFIGKLNTRSQLIQATDLSLAELYVLKCIQALFFSKEIEQVRKGQACRPDIRKLQPFLDGNGLLRVGGRLKHSELEFDHKFPILLPKSHHIIDLLIRHYHEKNLHTGPQMLMSILRTKFWILSARGIIRRIIRNCNVCFRSRPKPTTPMMADLPASRVLPSAAFSHTGVDYAGPFFITMKRGRGQRSHKAYLCLFICFSTKALHLEVAPDLSTDSFLNAFKRFLSRRGCCDVIWSDRGSNFIGAKGVLKEVYELLDTAEYKSKFQSELSEHRIQWKLNVASCPHFGGIWESSVKNVKTHLYKVVGQQVLSLDEFNTVLVQIEALLNSRPLTFLGDDPSELQCLTPAHFLVGKPLRMLPSLDVSNVNENRLTRPALLDSMVQRFWKRWHLEYLHTLQSRKKWDVSVPPITPGTIVLIIDDNAPPLAWLLGKVEKVYPGKDGVIRVADVRTKKALYTRPIVKLCPLPSQ